MAGRIYFSLAGLFFLSVHLYAQSPTSTKTADSLFEAKEWNNAVREYSNLSRDEPKNPYLLFKIGKCNYYLKKYDDAISFYKSSLKNGGRMSISLSVAEAFNKLGRQDSAYAWLQSLADNGFPDYTTVESDSNLSNLFSADRFKQILKQLRINNAPCTASDEYRQFDFWIGEWNVTSKGQQVGKSSIRLILDSCVIFENWTGMKEGKSFNMFDVISKTWKQTWVDYSGAWTEFIDGVYKDGKMVFGTRNEKQKDGTFIKRRLSFFNMDKNHVRQFSEQSNDNGISWRTEYDFLYTRVEK
jgi:hypothetical protein